MKNVKRILALTVSAALAVSCFAGCGNGAKKNSDTIVIGCSGPLTGDAAQYGVAVKNAIELAVKDVNDAGGINGTKLSYVFEDDEADSGDKAVNAYNALKDNGMQVMVGTVTTGSCLAVLKRQSRITSSSLHLLHLLRTLPRTITVSRFALLTLTRVKALPTISQKTSLLQR